MGHIDNGLFVISGDITSGVSFEEAEKSIKDELIKLQDELISDEELLKIKNKVESQFVFSEMNVLNKAMNLSFFELLGDANMLNEEVEKYNSVTREELKKLSGKLFNELHCSTLYYQSKS